MKEWPGYASKVSQVMGEVTPCDAVRNTPCSSVQSSDDAGFILAGSNGAQIASTRPRAGLQEAQGQENTLPPHRLVPPRRGATLVAPAPFLAAASRLYAPTLSLALTLSHGRGLSPFVTGSRAA